MATTIKITSETHDKLRRETLRLSGLLGARLTMETVIIAMLKLTEKYPDEMRELIK